MVACTSVIAALGRLCRGVAISSKAVWSHSDCRVSLGFTGKVWEGGRGREKRAVEGRRGKETGKEGKEGGKEEGRREEGRKEREGKEGKEGEREEGGRRRGNEGGNCLCCLVPFFRGTGM